MQGPVHGSSSSCHRAAAVLMTAGEAVEQWLRCAFIGAPLWVLTLLCREIPSTVSSCRAPVIAVGVGGVDQIPAAMSRLRLLVDRRRYNSVACGAIGRRQRTFHVERGDSQYGGCVLPSAVRLHERRTNGSTP